MEDTLRRRFLTEPRHTLQRRYEILRAYFVEKRSLHHIARQFGQNYLTLRSLVREFRVQCRTGRVFPILPSRVADGLVRTAKPKRAARRCHNPQ